MTYLDAALALVIGLAITSIALWWLSSVPQAAQNVRNDRGGSKISFLFRDRELIDTSRDANELLGNLPDPVSIETVLDLFRDRFPIPDTAEVSTGRLSLRALAETDSDVLEITETADTVRIELLSGPDAVQPAHEANHRLTNELEVLRLANSVSPSPIWQVDAKGNVVWFNEAYDLVFKSVHKRNPRPGDTLFDIPSPQLDPNTTRRVPVSLPHQRHSAWFDIQRKATSLGDFYSAVDANAIVRAEAAQRNFVQTLAKTFAHLPIGLAIFDEHRQLILFNPAVIDLTGLGADFLSSRPNLLSFFDELRNKRLMPEPKNYNSWRQQIADLVAAAADGRYSETWTLDSGRTYRVNGRPHPDGAIAFLIEDISSEISLTRSFRAELELSQSVIDNVDDAIVVFNASGVLTMSNDAYRTLWSTDPDLSFATTTIIDSQLMWQEHCKPSPVFGDIRGFVLELTERSTWEDTLEMLGGEILDLQVIPLISGATMIRFLRPVRAAALPASTEALDTP